MLHLFGTKLHASFSYTNHTTHQTKANTSIQKAAHDLRNRLQIGAVYLCTYARTVSLISP